MSCWCCGSMMVSYTGDDKFEPFYCNDKYFCHWNSLNSVKHLGETPLSSTFLMGVLGYNIFYIDQVLHYSWLFQNRPRVSNTNFNESDCKDNTNTNVSIFFKPINK